MVSYICLLVELGPICNSMAASLCLKSCEDHSLLKSYNGAIMEVYGKTFTGLGPVVGIAPVLLTRQFSPFRNMSTFYQ